MPAPYCLGIIGGVETLFVLRLQLVAEVGMGDLDEVAGALTEGSALQRGHAVLGDHIVHVVPLLDEGAAVTTSRNDVDYVVTEYGVAALKGRTLRQRAHNLIEIAHPDFRDELKAEYEKRFHCKYE